MQPPSLKSLARVALQRNDSCNTPATNRQKPCNKTGDFQGRNVARILGRLLEIGRDLGIPDYFVLNLPASELEATTEQYEAFTAENSEELGRKLLVFYLRSLAGIEPALSDSLAATTGRPINPLTKGNES